MRYLVREGCIVTEHQDKDEVSDDDLISISPAGWVHLELLANVDYLSACAEDTYVTDSVLAQHVAERIGNKGEYGHFSRLTTKLNSRDFVGYLTKQRSAWDEVSTTFLQDQLTLILDGLSDMQAAVKERSEVAFVEVWGETIRVGDRRSARVVSIKDFGVFVRLVGDVDGLVHISCFAKDGNGQRQTPKVGTMLTVRVIKVQPQTFKIECDLATK